MSKERFLLAGSPLSEPPNFLLLLPPLLPRLPLPLAVVAATVVVLAWRFSTEADPRSSDVVMVAAAAAGVEVSSRVPEGVRRPWDCPELESEERANTLLFDQASGRGRGIKNV